MKNFSFFDFSILEGLSLYVFSKSKKWKKKFSKCQNASHFLDSPVSAEHNAPIGLSVRPTVRKLSAILLLNFDHFRFDDRKSQKGQQKLVLFQMHWGIDWKRWKIDLPNRSRVKALNYF
jgi:hypothetical protein